MRNIIKQYQQENCTVLYAARIRVTTALKDMIVLLREAWNIKEPRGAVCENSLVQYLINKKIFTSDFVNKYFNSSDATTFCMAYLDECWVNDKLCIDDFALCDKCHGLFLRTNMATVGNDTLCPECQDSCCMTYQGNWEEKRLCVTVYDRNNVILGFGLKIETVYAVDTGRYYDNAEYLHYSRGKWYFSQPEPQGDPCIYNYHYHSNSFEYIGVNKNDKANQLGIELEIVANDDVEREDLTSIIAKNTDLFVFERDSSIGDQGVECISNITSLQYLITEGDKLKNVFDKVVRCGAHSHNTDCCGLHIHINRAAFGETLQEQTKTITKVIILVERFKELVEIFSRREENHYARFRGAFKQGLDYLDRDEIIEPPHHYYNVNTSKEKTVEFRMFRGTLEVDVIINSIKFCYALIEIAKRYNEQQLMYVRFAEILSTQSGLLGYYNSLTSPKFTAYEED